MSKARRPGTFSQVALPTQAPLFTWQAGGLLDHFVLQSVARGLKTGSRDIVLVVQDWWDETLPEPAQAAAALLLASPAVVGRYNLMPLAHLRWMVSLAAPGTEMLVTVAAVLGEQSAAEQETERRRLEEAQAALQSSVTAASLPDIAHDYLPGPGAISWLASGVPFEVSDVNSVFPQARRLLALPPAASGDCFLLDSLLKALTNSRQQWGLLLSAGQERNALATLIERI